MTEMSATVAMEPRENESLVPHLFRGSEYAMHETNHVGKD